MGLFLEHKQTKFQVGDTVKVYQIIKDGAKERIQIFEGLVIKIKGHEGTKSFVVRKISSGVGVEKIYPIDTPFVDKIEVVKKGDVRRAKLYYLRERIGRSALKVDERRDKVVVDATTKTKPTATKKSTEKKAAKSSEEKLGETGGENSKEKIAE